ncbi:MAG: EamA family transporter [Patescibacteria group bacterium]
MKHNPKTLALLAALLFGASAPISKLLLADFEPIQLAGFLYLGSGLGLLFVKLFQILLFKSINDKQEAKINRRDIKWLVGAIIFGGILAPVLMMTGLKTTQASTATLMLNFEAVSTTIIALLYFKEQIGKKVWLAVILLTVASIILTFNLTGGWGLSIGALGILLACILWGVDNNFTRNISAKDPLVIVIIKGLVSGTFLVLLSTVLGYNYPDINKIVYGLIVGFLSYGFSLYLFVIALRSLGSARTSAFFGLAPFLGTILSLIIFREFGNIMFYISLPFMVTGVYILFNEKHKHTHRHTGLIHEHKHRHNDLHHEHEENNLESTEHTHLHKHENTEHAHEHSPDIHHRHVH